MTKWYVKLGENAIRMVERAVLDTRKGEVWFNPDSQMDICALNDLMETLWDLLDEAGMLPDPEFDKYVFYKSLLNRAQYEGLLRPEEVSWVSHKIAIHFL